jgi:hypothetical protein
MLESGASSIHADEQQTSPKLTRLAASPHAPLPSFQHLVVDSSPQGVVIRPRSMAVSWLIEAAVWVAAAGGAAGMIVLSQVSWVRMLGALVLVPVGIRALMRTIRFVSVRWLFDAQGVATHLVTLEPREEPDYRALAGWIAASGFRR